MYISEIKTTVPTDERCALETKVYETLSKLSIPFELVDNDSVESMEECIEISEKLGAEIRKTIFLCNRKKTSFYMVILPANKSFNTKEHCKKMDVSRLSFASGDLMMQHLDVAPGTATIMSLINDPDEKVELFIDKEIANSEFFACNPGANTTHLKIKTKDLLNKLLPKIDHPATIIEF